MQAPDGVESRLALQRRLSNYEKTRELCIGQRQYFIQILIEEARRELETLNHWDSPVLMEADRDI